jgi:Transglycosylase SLT domain
MQTTLLKKLLWLTFYCLPLIAFAAHGTESRAETVFPKSARHFSLPGKVIIYKNHRAQLASVSRLPANPLKLQSDRPNPQEVKTYVQTEAVEHGINPKLALWIVKHESQFNPYAKGDGEASRGLWQISRIYHPEVSDAVAFNVASSTEWSLERIRSGKVNEWSTYRFCRTLYEDCPF